MVKIMKITMHLCRHGNTFNSGDRVVWVGKGQDLPLVESGKIQAETLSNTLLQENIRPSLIYCSSLQRTRTFAFIIGQKIAPSVPIIAHSNLDELDYGHWGGLTNDEVIERYGKAVIDSWQNDGIFPAPHQGNWGDDLNGVMQKIHQFMDDLRNDLSAISSADQHHHVVIVSSNGLLRFFLKLIPNAFDDAVYNGTLKLPTGGRRILRV